MRAFAIFVLIAALADAHRSTEREFSEVEQINMLRGEELVSDQASVGDEVCGDEFTFENCALFSTPLDSASWFYGWFGYNMNGVKDKGCTKSEWAKLKMRKPSMASYSYKTYPYFMKLWTGESGVACCCQPNGGLHSLSPAKKEEKAVAKAEMKQKNATAAANEKAIKAAANERAVKAAAKRKAAEDLQLWSAMKKKAPK